MVGELRFINFDSPAHLTQLVLSIVVLVINMDQVPYSPEDIMHIIILEFGDAVLHQIAISL